MIALTATIQKGSILLPDTIKKNWKNEKVFLFPMEDTLIIKKIQKKPASQIAASVREPRMTEGAIEKEIMSYRLRKSKQ